MMMAFARRFAPAWTLITPIFKIDAFLLLVSFPLAREPT
jgi:hypothetical protein